MLQAHRAEVARTHGMFGLAEVARLTHDTEQAAEQARQDFLEDLSHEKGPAATVSIGFRPQSGRHKPTI